MTDKSTLDDLLSTDALALAERLTGKSYKDDESTSAVGMGLHMLLGEEKDRVLREAGDTSFRMDLNGVLEVYERLGFLEVYKEFFKGIKETWRVLWQPDKGILAIVESYNTTGVNTHSIYFNLRVTEDSWWPEGCSGHFHRESYDTGSRVWVGDKDAREGVARFIERAEEEGGEFLTTWVENPLHWLYNYAEEKPSYGGGDWEGHQEIVRKAVNAKIAQFPRYVQAAIGPYNH